MDSGVGGVMEGEAEVEDVDSVTEVIVVLNPVEAEVTVAVVAVAGIEAVEEEAVGEEE